MGNPGWAVAKSRAQAEGSGEGQELLGVEGEEEGEVAYRLHVVQRLPGLVALDCVDVTEAERARAKSANDNKVNFKSAFRARRS